MHGLINRAPTWTIDLIMLVVGACSMQKMNRTRAIRGPGSVPICPTVCYTFRKLVRTFVAEYHVWEESRSEHEMGMNYACG